MEETKYPQCEYVFNTGYMCGTKALDRFEGRYYCPHHLESRRTKRAADVLVRCKKCNALIETTVHCDACGTFEPTRR